MTKAAMGPPQSEKHIPPKWVYQIWSHQSPIPYKSRWGTILHKYHQKTSVVELNTSLRGPEKIAMILDP
jgi:hypothetical protein